MTSKIRMAVVAAGAVALAACGGAASTSGGSAASATIGPSGGTVTSGAVTLKVGAGALSKETQIGVSDLPGADGHRRIEIEPSGLALAAPATLTVRSDDGNASDERLVEIERSSSGEVEHSMAGETENEVEHAREVEIEHLGTFEDRPANACNPGCDAGFECDDGVCKAHGGDAGGSGGTGGTGGSGSGGGADDPANHG